MHIFMNSLTRNRGGISQNKHEPFEEEQAFLPDLGHIRILHEITYYWYITGIYLVYTNLSRKPDIYQVHTSFTALKVVNLAQRFRIARVFHVQHRTCVVSPLGTRRPWPGSWRRRAAAAGERGRHRQRPGGSGRPIGAAGPVLG